MLATATSSGQITTTNFFNWETAPIHPVAVSPDGTRLAVCNLPDNRIELFDITSGKPVAITNIPVGLDPVSVRFRTSSELWVANYISDSISIIVLPTMRVVSTITTSNEPSDIVFAGTPQRAYVSCGQPNLIQVFNTSTLQMVTNLVIEGNRPRGLDVSPDGSKVYVALFESGNSSTIIGVGISSGFPKPTAIDFPNAPSRGQNPPPNSGTNFVPAINPSITNPPPRVSLIVKKNSAGRWMDDNQGDWTEYIRGTNAAFTGRIPGWDVVDHDLATIDTSTLAINYTGNLMNICMSLAENPSSGKIAVIGTDGLNSIRFEPVLNGIFVRVNLALAEPDNSSTIITDLNSHLTYQTSQVAQIEREKSIGDPRGIVWNSAGTRAYITGMGSDNLIVINAQGNRAGIHPAIAVGQGPTGLALDETRNRLYVLNRFDGSISTLDTTTQAVVDTLAFFDPTPTVIKLGRPHLYNTHQTSGLGQAACGSCHVDSRFDRLAWDLGSPPDIVKVINTTFNFVTAPDTTNSFHPMKGPMVTLTLQDIITHEPFHWRGDRDGIEEFDGTFTNLQGAVSGLTSSEMQDFKSFLATIRFAPSPFRNLDNTLSTNLPLPGHFVLGRGALPAGSPLPNGNAAAGQLTFRTNSASGCIPCHTLPAGLGTDMHFNGTQWVPVALGTNSAHHIAMVELERASELPLKVPSLRNLFDKIGMDLTRTNSRFGFGFSHDGSVDTLVRFMQDAFVVTNDQTAANLTAFLLSLSGSDLIPGSLNDIDRSPGVPSLDTQAAVGRQITINSSASVPLIDTMITLANISTTRVDLVVKGFKDGLLRGWFFERGTGLFRSDRQVESLSASELRALATVGSEQTYMMVPRGCGKRIGVDRDADGYFDRDELDAASDPANPLSVPRPGSILTLSTNASLAWNAIAGRSYRLQFKDGITDTNWTDIPGDIVATTNIASQVDPSPATNATRFYRILALP